MGETEVRVFLFFLVFERCLFSSTQVVFTSVIRVKLVYVGFGMLVKNTSHSSEVRTTKHTNVELGRGTS